MIKKLYIFLILCLLIQSCGKKDDPIYKAQKSELFDTKVKVVL